MNSEQFQESTGWRGVFHCLPQTKAMAQKIIMPLGFFHSPFIASTNPLKVPPALCNKCKASISSFSPRNRQNRSWNCNFCSSNNAYLSQIGTAQVQQYVQGKSGDNGIFFIIDLCVSSAQLKSIKETLIQTIQKMPKTIFVGLMFFNRNIFIQDFSEEEIKFSCLSGNEAIQSLQSDSHFIPREDRQKRATGCALQCAIGLINDIGINTRFVLLIGGPCTVGLGKVVNLPLKCTIRSYVDILEGNQNAELVKSATLFYDSLELLVVKFKHTVDIWAYGLDQFGLMQMRSLVNSSGGLLAMHEEFNHFIFQTSFQKFYEQNEEGLFQFPIACNFSIHASKQIKINGIIGSCKSLKDNTAKLAAQMQIGQGMTNAWYLGGIQLNSALCIIVSMSDLATNQNKQRSALIQAVTSFKYSDNIVRTRVSTFSVDFIRENQMIEVIKRFDQQAATVMLARLASKKAEIQQPIQVKKWLDRILLKFTVKFAQYNRMDKSSFRLPHMMKHFPQFMYHLRRSSFINPFGSPPDQAMYTKTCMIRESLANCIVMIQPALLKYTVDSKEPVPVELDFQQLKDEVILLLDSYFNVLVWYGESVQSWKDQNLQEDPNYQYLVDFFTMPMQDASEIMYDRIPSSNFYQTFKNDGKQRYLKSRVNPSKSNASSQNDGHFVSDDAPIKLFMDFLVKSVLNYTD